jgi:hypothetical protein
MNMLAFSSRLLSMFYAALKEEKDLAEASLLSVQVRVHLLVEESQSPISCGISTKTKRAYLFYSRGTNTRP